MLNSTLALILALTLSACLSAAAPPAPSTADSSCGERWLSCGDGACCPDGFTCGLGQFPALSCPAGQCCDLGLGAGSDPATARPRRANVSQRPAVR